MSWFRLDCRFRIGPPGVRPLDSLLWFGVLDLGASFLSFTFSSCVYDLSSVSVVVSSPLDVTSETSRMIRSNSAVSSACFWLWRAIFSLNFLGFAIVVVDDAASPEGSFFSSSLARSLQELPLGLNPQQHNFSHTLRSWCTAPINY